MREAQLRAEEGAPGVDFIHQIESLDFSCIRSGHLNGAGIVNQDIDPAKLAHIGSRRSRPALLTGCLPEEARLFRQLFQSVRPRYRWYLADASAVSRFSRLRQHWRHLSQRVTRSPIRYRDWRQSQTKCDLLNCAVPRGLSYRVCSITRSISLPSRHRDRPCDPTKAEPHPIAGVATGGHHEALQFQSEWFRR
jgi:hypothetical protein